MATSFQSRLGTSPEEGVKAPVAVATTANITLSGLQTINGYTTVAGDRVLVKDQTDATENGIYDAATGSWTRAKDWNKANDVVNGVLVLDANTGQLYRASFSGTFIIGTTSVNFYDVDTSTDRYYDTLTLAQNDNTIQIGDKLIIKTIDGGANETTMIFDVIANVTEDIPNGIYDSTVDTTISFQMRDRDLLEASTVAELIARKDFKIGTIIKTLGYTSISDGGHSEYRVVAAATGTADGGSYIDLTGITGQIELIHNSKVRVEQLGVVPNDDTAGTTNATSIESARVLGVKHFIYGPVKYYIDSIILPHSGSYYRHDTGVTHEGVKGQTFLSRDEAGVAAAYPDEDDIRAVSLFRIYGSHHTVRGIVFEECAVALFLGQDPDERGIEKSSITLNNFIDVDIQNCGTGYFIATTDTGTFFNNWKRGHIQQCQIGMHVKKGEDNTSGIAAQFNRNWLIGLRISRCYIGALMDDCSTGYFLCEFEGNKTSPSNNVYSMPDPSISPSDISDSTALVFGQISGINTITSVMEDNARHVTDESTDGNMYIGASSRFFEGVTSTKLPLCHLDRDAIIQEDFLVAMINGIPGVPYKAGNVYTLAPHIEYVSAGENHNTLIDYGDIDATNTTTIEIQPDESQLADVTTVFNVTVCADEPDDNLAFGKKFSIVARRNSSRSLVRYHIFDEVNMRATGAAVGDSSEPIVAALVVNGKDLELSLTAPSGRDLKNVIVIIEELIGGHR